MFKIEEQKSVKWPVTVSIPRDGGRTTKATFTVEFELIPEDEKSAIYKDGGNDEDLLRRTVVNFEGVADSDDNPIPFSEEALDKLIKITYVRTAMTNAYLECSFGKAAARKN